MAENNRKPQKECVFCQASKNSCKALNRLYCAEETKECRFYKSKYEYNLDGTPKGDK